MDSRKTALTLAVIAPLILASACKKSDGAADSTASGQDTVITTHAVRDTTVVKSDTTIHTDTVKATHHDSNATKP